MTLTKRAARVAWCAACVLLAAVLIAVNLPGKPADAPAGHEPGQRPPDFTLATLDGGAFTLSGQRGRVTVINLWATWCGPCVRELPHFDRLRLAYPDDVAVLAIHSDLVTEDVAAYLALYDYGIAFAVDTDGAVIASLGGSTMLPQTIVLDRSGIVTYNRVGSVTYEALEELVLAAMQP